MTQITNIPILLLKTKSQPIDTYEECFLKAHAEKVFTFEPHFIPVLEHAKNDATLGMLGAWVNSGELKRKYGGMIFTSQRAVEAWTDIVVGLNAANLASTAFHTLRQTIGSSQEHDPFANLESLTPFPLYVVGPATERALQSLSGLTRGKARLVYADLNATIHGAHSGNGANLAAFMLKHYNQLYAQHWFSYFEAPRLPFIPLLGMSSENYGRKRLDENDVRLKKKPLLFLVGEQRRDVIPKTLQNHPVQERRIVVHEVEVYRTEVVKEFDSDFVRTNTRLDLTPEAQVRVVVVFSPQGCEAMLKRIEYLDAKGNMTEQATRRWWQQDDPLLDGRRWIIVTIGPTTRDYLQKQFGIEPEVCAAQPNPQSLRDGVESFLAQHLLEKRVASSI